MPLLLLLPLTDNPLSGQTTILRRTYNCTDSAAALIAACLRTAPKSQQPNTRARVILMGWLWRCRTSALQIVVVRRL
jgi:hypothetical protein